MKLEKQNSIRFRTQYNGVPSEYQGEMNTLPSETVPGEALSVKEILQRYTRGIDPAISKVPSFEFEDDHEDFDAFNPRTDPAFDLADATEIIAQSNLTLSEAKKQIAEKRKKAKAAFKEKTDPNPSDPPVKEAGDKGIPG